MRSRLNAEHAEIAEKNSFCSNLFVSAVSASLFRRCARDRVCTACARLRSRSRPTCSSSPACRATRSTPRSFEKWAAEPSSTPRKKKDAVPDANITLSRRQARRRRDGVEKAFTDLAGARPAERQRRRPADRPRQLRRHCRPPSTSPGPDLTVADWCGCSASCRPSAWRSSTPRSSSGAFLPAVAAPGRVVVTATKTGGERNETLVPRSMFVGRFNDTAADRDRNGHVSIGEAFEYAKAKVGRGVSAEGAAAHRARARWTRARAARRRSRLAATHLPRTRRAEDALARRARAIRRCARWSTSAAPSSSRSPALKLKENLDGRGAMRRGDGNAARPACALKTRERSASSRRKGQAVMRTAALLVVPGVLAGVGSALAQRRCGGGGCDRRQQAIVPNTPLRRPVHVRRAIRYGPDYGFALAGAAAGRTTTRRASSTS